MIVPPSGLILNVLKPRGLTSFDVVRQIRKQLRMRKVGHCGTLDPLAEGVLIILVGKATRRAGEFSSLDKTYIANLKLGLSTDTYDITGKIICEKSTLDLNSDTILSALQHFTGEIEQVPPMFSALKIAGQRLYQLARKGEVIERKPRKIVIYSISLDDWNNPHLKITVHCSKGTYIRSLANDLGQFLGCGACLEGLTRVKVGGFKIEDALKLEEIY